MNSQLQSLIDNQAVSVENLVIIGIALGVLLAFLGLSGILRRDNPRSRRLAEHVAPRLVSSIEAGLLRPAAHDPTGLMRGLIPVDRKERTKVQLQLRMAGATGPHALRNFYLIRLSLGLLLPGLVATLILVGRSGLLPLPGAVAHWFNGFSLQQVVLVLSLLAGAGFFGPAYWLANRVTERRRAIEESFPNVLDLLQISVESGLGLDAAMIRVANETQQSAPAISEEMMIAQREIQAGRSRDKALMDMAARTGVPQVVSFAGVVLQSLQFGSSISDALAVYSEEMRVSRELRAQDMANKLPVKMSAVMASLMLPALLMLALGPVVIRYMSYMAG